MIIMIQLFALYWPCICGQNSPSSLKYLLKPEMISCHGGGITVYYSYTVLMHAIIAAQYVLVFHFVLYQSGYDAC